MTAYKTEDDAGVCGRTLNLRENDGTTYWQVAHRYDLINKLPVGYAIQAELVGEGIQDNRLKIKGHDIYVFYAIEIAKMRFLELEEMEELVGGLGLKTVPIIDRDFVLDHTLEQLLSMANRPSPLTPSVPQEGTVYRLKGAQSKFSFKAISNEYLLKYGL
jgi:hypothetical protein